MLVCCSCCSADGGVETRRGPERRQEQVEESLLGQGRGLFLDLFGHLALYHVDADLGKVADDGLHVAPHVADLGELGRLDLEERGLDELCEPAGDLGLAHAGGTDHDDVLRHDLVAEVLGQALPPPAVPERDGNGPLGLVLADDVLVELFDDLSWCQGIFQKNLRANAEWSQSRIQDPGVKVMFTLDSAFRSESAVTYNSSIVISLFV